MKVMCENCTTVFEKKIAEINRTKHNFCSKKCRGVYFSNTTINDKYVENKKTLCWEFTGALNNSGYGVVRFKGKPRLAHRVMFSIAFPDVNIEKLQVLHKCDNPKCVNPLHLFTGSHQDNMADMTNKGRRYRKEINK